MEKKIRIIIVASIAMTMFLACGRQRNEKKLLNVEVTTAERPNEKKVSRGMFEIIALYLPDSVTFKLVGGFIEWNSLSVSLVSITDTLQAGKMTASGQFNLGIAQNGEKVPLLTNTSEVCAKKFNLPANFEPQKIKFVVDNLAVMYYNIAEDKWE